MANSEALAKWLLDNSAALKLNVLRFDWPSDWGLATLSDFEVLIEVNGNEFYGRGTDSSEELAFTKAGAEAIERAFCFENGLRSSGVAAHISATLAQQNAKTECIERDAFFCHYLTQTPFDDLEIPLEVQKRYAETFEVAKTHGFQIRFHILKSLEALVVLCVAEQTNETEEFGAFVGLGCDLKIHRAAEKALVEVLRNLSAIGDENPSSCPITLKDFERIVRPKGRDHQNLARSAEYWRAIKKKYFITDTTAGVVEQPILKAASIYKYTRLEKQPAIFSGAPVEVWRCEISSSVGAEIRISNQILPISLLRLSEFKSRELTFNELETVPHFLG